MNALITGGAGFIGSNLAEKLLSLGHAVNILDNFTTGQRRFINDLMIKPGLSIFEGDILQPEVLNQAMQGCDFIFHLAANADVRYGGLHPHKDFEQNTIGTQRVLEAMRQNNIFRIAFTSTGSVYGEPASFPTPENTPFPVQTSFYAASKLAGEGLIEAYCENFGFEGYIFRLVSVLGEHYSHGHVFDFFKSLKKDPSRLMVLGDGNQTKSYLYVQDCIDGILRIIEKARERINIYNLGTDETCSVRDSLGWMTSLMGCHPVVEYSGGPRGWVGDSPVIYLDCQKARDLGWEPHLTIREGILKTIQYLENNPWLLKAR